MTEDEVFGCGEGGHAGGRGDRRLSVWIKVKVVFI